MRNKLVMDIKKNFNKRNMIIVYKKMKTSKNDYHC